MNAETKSEPAAEIQSAPAPAPVSQPSTLNSTSPSTPKLQHSSTPPPPPPGETPRAAEAFRVYLELGPRRRYSAVVKKVGASLRTVKRWANDFDWRHRIRKLAADQTDRFIELDRETQREEVLDAAARLQALRERQYTVAEALLDVSERYLDHVDTDDLDQINFADACKALEVATRLGRDAAAASAEPPAKPFDDQFLALLDQAYGDRKSPESISNPEK